MKAFSSAIVLIAVLLVLPVWRLAASPSNATTAADLNRMLRRRSYLELEKALASDVKLSPEERSLFKGVMANRRNRAADSIKLLQPLVATLSASDKEDAVIALSTLADDYEKTFQYSAASDTYAELVQNFSQYMSAEEVRKAQQEVQRWSLLRRAPAQSAEVDGGFKIDTRRNRLGLQQATVIIAGQATPVILDTGANISVISQSVAQRLRLKLLPGEATIEGITGDRVLVHAAVIPQLRIGKAKFRNVAVVVVADKDLFLKSVHYALPGSLGFPVLSALGRITFFADQKFGVNLRADNVRPSKNLFLQRLTPIVAATIAGRQELFTVDTGAEGSFLSAHYYDDHPHQFDSKYLDELVLGGAGGTRRIPAYYAHQIDLGFGDACVRLKDVPVLITPRGISDDYFYGNLGQTTLRQFSSYTFDFQNMSFSVDGQPCGPSK